MTKRRGGHHSAADGKRDHEGTQGSATPGFESRRCGYIGIGRGGGGVSDDCCPSSFFFSLPDLRFMSLIRSLRMTGRRRQPLHDPAPPNWETIDSPRSGVGF